MSNAPRFSSLIRVLAAAAFLFAFTRAAAAQSKRPQPTPEQKACAKTGKAYFDSLHLKGGSLFGTHYDSLSQACEAEYVVIHDGITRLAIDDATKRENLASYQASEKTGKTTECHVLSTRCQSEGEFLNLSAKVLRWITF